MVKLLTLGAFVLGEALLRDDPMDFMDQYSRDAEKSLHIDGRALEESNKRDHTSHSWDDVFATTTTAPVAQSTTQQDISTDNYAKATAEMEALMDHARHDDSQRAAPAEVKAPADDFHSFAIASSDSDSTAGSVNTAQSSADTQSESNQAQSSSRQESNQAESNDGASAESNQGGQVVDINLESELQVSLLEGKARRSGLRLKARTVPDVATAVEQQRMQDVYIHDEFVTAAAADVKQEQQVHADRDLKA